MNEWGVRDLCVICIEPEVKALGVNNGTWVKGATSTLHDPRRGERETEGQWEFILDLDSTTNSYKEEKECLLKKSESPLPCNEASATWPPRSRKTTTTKTPRLAPTSSLLPVTELRNGWWCPRTLTTFRGCMGSWEIGNEVVTSVLARSLWSSPHSLTAHHPLF